MKIEWASHFNPDGTRCRPPPSTMHGWLAKMRGTLIGDEELRSRGMREMREAAARRKRQAQAKKQRSAAAGKSIFSVLGFGSSPKPPPIAHKPAVLKQRPPQSRRTTRDSARSGQSSRVPPRPAGPSSRSTQRRRTQDSGYTSRSGQRRSSGRR